MNTAMQELLDNLESIDIKVPLGVKLIFIEKEKEQIRDAWIEGGGYSRLSEESDRILAEQYYSQTYNK